MAYLNLGGGHERGSQTFTCMHACMHAHMHALRGNGSSRPAVLAGQQFSPAAKGDADGAHVLFALLPEPLSGPFGDHGAEIHGCDLATAEARGGCERACCECENVKELAEKVE